MSALPGRPDLDQLRRQARELLRAAAANDEEALRRIRAVSDKQTLSAAHLAIAREHGFASWPRLRAEVLRQGAEPDAGSQVETFGYPEFLVADAEELIDKQYADRPRLRPVFDAVLRTLPAMPGPITVQARGTLVSLVSPRRTFAVLKPATTSRIDLGLRLAGATTGKSPPRSARQPQPLPRRRQEPRQLTTWAWKSDTPGSAASVTS